MPGFRRTPTLTLITGTGYVAPESTGRSYDGLICAGIEQVLAEPMTEIFDVDLAHFIGELRNGYKDVLIDLVEDSLRTAPVLDVVRFEGTGTFVLDWNAPPVVKLEFTWNGPFYSIVFHMVREGMRKYCALERIVPMAGRSMEEAAAHLLSELWRRLAQKNQETI